MRRFIKGSALFFSVFLFVATTEVGHARDLNVKQINQLIRYLDPHVKDSYAWAKDLVDVFTLDRIDKMEENYCAVLAIISQESGFRANPSIPNLGSIAMKQVNKKLDSLPLKSGKAIRAILKDEYFYRIANAKTERDLDLVYRDILSYMPSVPFVDSKPIRDFIDNTNDIDTIGSMQVSVKYAIRFEEYLKGRKLTLKEIWDLRDSMYNRKMGIHYGTLQLLNYKSGYTQKIHRFADYNAGRYASRNAAFQYTIGKLLDQNLATDGDLLIYDGNEAKSKESNTEKAIQRVSDRYGLRLEKWQIRGDLLKEKSPDFYQTKTYALVRDTYRLKFGKSAPKAMIPNIRLSSEKTSTILTTEKFAKQVNKRYQRCMAKARQI